MNRLRGRGALERKRDTLAHVRLVAVRHRPCGRVCGLRRLGLLRSGHLGGGWESLRPIWPYVAGRLLVVAAFTGGPMWLAFYSARRGQVDLDRKDQALAGRVAAAFQFAQRALQVVLLAQ